MNICKRDGTEEIYTSSKIGAAIRKSFASVGTVISDADLELLVKKVEDRFPDEAWKDKRLLAVEEIQDYVEQTLMEQGYYQEVKSYILYRDQRTRSRRSRRTIADSFDGMPRISSVLASVQKEYPEEAYDLEKLSARFRAFLGGEASDTERLHALIKASAELTTQEEPRWEMIAARFRLLEFELQMEERMSAYHIHGLYEKLRWLTDEGLYGDYILEAYSRDEIETFESYLDPQRNHLLTYSSLELLLTRYVICSRKGEPLETPQEMFLGIAMHLAMNEDKASRSDWVKRFYEMLSTLKVTVATPTLSNARKPFHQLSSCFIDTVPDSLDGIYRSIDNFSKVSKYGGGMGLYFGKVRASGSAIRGFEGAAGGVIRWIRLANDTAVAVDQLGVRQGAVAVYLDVWHRDLPEFLNLRTNNGDERMKAHDVFPAVCYPDYFWKQTKENMDGDWYLMCPHEILKVKGYCLEDSFGDEWEERYLDCVRDERIRKRVIPVKEIVRLIIRSEVETGTPFAFNRDTVNRANPNKHRGVIYCSNLCTEIAQNMKEIELVEQRVETSDGDTVVVTVTRPGEFVVCNLASLSLGHIDVDNYEEIEHFTESAMRALDNVIDLNFFPLPYAKINNMKYRPVGLGVSGYHHMLAKHGIKWESQEHLDFADRVFEDIHYAAVKASCNNAKEKGRYEYFSGSDWESGAYFVDRDLTEGRWVTLAADVRKNGLRNGYLLATAPTSSTSIIAGTSAGLDPIMNRFFLEEKKNGLMPRVAPELCQDNFWYYKSAHTIDQSWSVKASGVRQRHIDQAQSMNLYITNDYTFRRVLELYLLAWECGVKTIYYIRSKSLEVEECEVCSS